jgi:hypothetical protein
MGGSSARPTVDHANKERKKATPSQRFSSNDATEKTSELDDELKHKLRLDTVRCGISPLAARCGEVGAWFC